MHWAEMKGRAASWISTASGEKRRERLKASPRRKAAASLLRERASEAFPMRALGRLLVEVLVARPDNGQDKIERADGR